MSIQDILPNSILQLYSDLLPLPEHYILCKRCYQFIDGDGDCCNKECPVKVGDDCANMVNKASSGVNVNSRWNTNNLLQIKPIGQMDVNLYLLQRMALYQQYVGTVVLQLITRLQMQGHRLALIDYTMEILLLVAIKHEQE
jgi:hypothetical protein